MSENQYSNQQMNQTITPSRKGKLISQEWYDENRDRFNAETTSTDKEINKQCSHQGFLKRKTANQVICTRCNSGWYDAGEWILSDGTLLKTSK